MNSSHSVNAALMCMLCMFASFFFLVNKFETPYYSSLAGQLLAVLTPSKMYTVTVLKPNHQVLWSHLIRFNNICIIKFCLLSPSLQSIEDTQSKPAATTTTTTSPRIETAASITSGPVSTGPLSTTSQKGETPEPGPNATYASVSGLPCDL